MFTLKSTGCSNHSDPKCMSFLLKNVTYVKLTIHQDSHKECILEIADALWLMKDGLLNLSPPKKLGKLRRYTTLN